MSDTESLSLEDDSEDFEPLRRSRRGEAVEFSVEERSDPVRDEGKAQKRREQSKLKAEEERVAVVNKLLNRAPKKAKAAAAVAETVAPQFASKLISRCDGQVLVTTAETHFQRRPLPAKEQCAVCKSDRKYRHPRTGDAFCSVECYRRIKRR